MAFIAKNKKIILALLFTIFLITTLIITGAKLTLKQTQETSPRPIPISDYREFREKIKIMPLEQVKKMKISVDEKLIQGHFAERFKNKSLTDDEATQLAWLTFQAGTLKIKLLELDLAQYE